MGNYVLFKLFIRQPKKEKKAKWMDGGKKKEALKAAASIHDAFHYFEDLLKARLLALAFKFPLSLWNRYSTNKMNHTCLAKVSGPSVVGGKKCVQCALWDEAGRNRAGDPFFTVTMTEHLHGLPREVVDSPSLDIFKTQLDMALSNLVHVGDPALSRWWDEMISRCLFQPPVILWHEHTSRAWLFLAMGSLIMLHPGQLLGRSLNMCLLIDLHLSLQDWQLSFHRQQAESSHSFYIYFTKQTKMHWPVLLNCCFCFAQLGRWSRFTAASSPWVTQTSLLICSCWLLMTQTGHSLVT